MCYAVYIGSNFQQKSGEWTENETVFYIQELHDENEINGLRPKFSKTFIYYAGSYQGCSCGFAFHPAEEADSRNEDDQKEEIRQRASVEALIGFIKKLSSREMVEFYCCWEGDWEDPVESTDKINIDNITVENYLLTEKRFIRIYSQS